MIELQVLYSKKNNSAKHYLLGASSAWTIDPGIIKKRPMKMQLIS